MGSFDTFKKQSAEKKEKMKEAFKSNSNKDYKKEIDTRFWQPTKLKDDTCSAIIRLVGLKDHDEANFITIYDYIFKNPSTNKWYWAPSLRTIGEEDPVAKYNAARWASGYEDECRHRKLSTTNITNIYVVKDAANPENEGKVFLYKFGGQIKKLISKTLEGVTDGEDVIEEGYDPFDLWNGANLLIKGEYKQNATVETSDGDKKGLYTYENSKFLTQTSLLKGDDEKLKTEVFDAMFEINEFINPSNFKSYDELSDKLAAVEGISREELDDIIEDFVSSKKKVPRAKVEEKEVVPAKKGKKAKTVEVVAEEVEELNVIESLDHFDDEELDNLMNLSD
jgi:hypothetical protein